MNTNKELLNTIREALEKANDINAFAALAALDQLEAQQADITKLVDEVSNTVQAVVAAFERKCGLSEYSDKNKSLVKSMRDAADALLYGTYTAAKSAAPTEQADIAKLIESGDTMLKRLLHYDNCKWRKTYVSGHCSCGLDNIKKQWVSAKSATKQTTT